MKIFNNPTFENEVIELLKNTKTLISTDFVAYNLRINWVTARSPLLGMSLKGQIKAIKTTRGYIFSSLEEEPAPQNDKAMTKQ